MESLGQAAARLLRRLERAAKAKGIDRAGLSGLSRAAPPCSDDAQPSPDTGDGIMPKDRTAKAMPRGLEIRMRLPLALGREGLFPRRPSRPSGAQVAANQNDPVHGRASYGIGKPL